MALIKIGLAHRAPSPTVERFGKYDLVIPYTIDGGGAFEALVPEEDFTPLRGEDAVRAAAQNQVALLGKEIIL